MKIDNKKGNIAKAIRTIVNSKPFIKEAMSKGIVNYSALAELIRGDVEKICGNKVSSKESLVAALIRFNKNIEPTSLSENIIKTVANLEFSVKTNIRLLSVPKQRMKKEHLSKIYERFEIENEERLIMFQGIKDVIIVCDEPNFLFLKDMFESEIELLQDKSAVFTVHSEGIPNFIPGYLEFFTSLLAENGINIEIYSSKEDLTLLIEEKDVGKTYELLNKAKLNAQEVLSSKKKEI